MIGTIGRFGKLCLTTLKKTFFGIGGIALLVIAGLYIAGALIEPVRWYLVGIASALLLLGGGLLALFYVRFILNRFASEQRRQVSDIKKAMRASEAELKKEIKTIKDDFSLIGYDLFREQNKLAEKVSQLESQASNDKTTDESPNDSINSIK